MSSAAIEKPAAAWRLPPNLRDYDQTCRGFSWEESRRGLAGLPGGRGLNIAHEAVEMEAAGPRATREGLG